MPTSPAAALAAAHRQRPSPLVDVVLGQRERLLDARPGAPQDDDHRPDPPAVAVIWAVAQHGHDLVHRWRIRRVAHALVARRPAGVITRHRHRRTPPP
jgi:hypothetical protein